MKKTNFFKLFMVGAFTLSLGLASCNYVSESDFEEVCDRVSAVELSIAELTTKLNAVEAGNYVTDVTKNEDGDLVVAYKTGSPTIVELDHPTDGPGDPPSVGFVALGENGNWFIDDEDTGIPAIGPAPKVEDGKWVFPTLVDGEIEWVEGEEVIYNAYVTNANGVWTLHIADADGELQAIPLPSGTTGIAKIEVLGWTKGFTEASDGIDMTAATATGFVDGLNDKFPILYAYVAATTAADATANEETYAAKDQGTAGTWNYADKANGADVVAGGKILVNKDVTLYANQGIGVVVQVYPATQDISSLTGFELQNSKGEAAPIVFGAPVLITGYLTRAAAASSALYYLPVALPATPGFKKDKFKEAIEKPGADVVWSLVTPDGLMRSDYALKIIGKPVTSVKNAVFEVGGEAPVAGTLYEEVSLEINKEHGIEFNATKYGAGGNISTLPADNLNDANITDAVIDYYLEVSAAHKAQFGLQFSENNQKFTVTVLPDAVTPASFDLNIYTLGVDGKIYLETIEVTPIRQVIGADVVALGDYIVEDVDPATADDYMSTPITIDLKTMLDKLAATTHAGTSTMLDKWKTDAKKITVTLKKEGSDDDQWPIFSNGKYAIIGATADAAAAVAAGDNHTIKFGNSVAPAKNIKGGFVQATKGLSFINGLKSNGDIDATMANWTKLYFVPNYAYDSDENSNNGTPGDVKGTFEIDKEYTMVVTFRNNDDEPISSITATFTPKMPALSAMFKKEESAFWTGNTLNAYYREPATWANGWFYDNDGDGSVAVTDDIPWANKTATKGSTFFNVYNAGATKHEPNLPADYGFLKAGMGDPTKETRWVYYADLALADGNQKIGSSTAGAYIRTGSAIPEPGYSVNDVSAMKDGAYTNAAIGERTNATTVELMKQTAGQASNIDNDAYGKEIGMKWNIGKYLGVYSYPEDDVKALGFNIKIMSALFEDGEIVGSDNSQSVVVPAGGTGDDIAVISNKNIKGKNYADRDFALFKYLAAPDKWQYQYRYIKSVQFDKDGEAAAWDFVDNTSDANTIETLPTTSYPFKTGVDTNGKDIIEDVVRIRATTLSNTVDAEVKVIVTDRFGRKLEDTISIQIQL